LKGPLSNLASNETAVDAILAQAVRLADNLAFAFDTPTGIPSNNLYFNPDSTDGSTTNGLATIGTLVLEWTHLSDLTGNPKYATLSQKGESYLLAPKPPTSEPWPGLVGTNVNLVRFIPILNCCFFARSRKPETCLKSRMTDQRITTAPETDSNLSAIIEI
jgi:mannosyl-oligosaccharide alpha-1,2-mannosidase